MVFSPENFQRLAFVVIKYKISSFHSFWSVKYTKATWQTFKVDSPLLLARPICGQGFVAIAFIQVKVLEQGLYTTQ